MAVVNLMLGANIKHCLNYVDVCYQLPFKRTDWKICLLFGKMATVILEYLNSYETELLKLTFLKAMILWETCCERCTRSVGMLFAVQKGKYKACLHCD